MNFALEAPPVEPMKIGSRTNCNYDELFGALKNNPGAWVRLDSNDVTGATPKNKQIALHQAAKTRGVRIQTTCQRGMIYLRVAEGGE